MLPWPCLRTGPTGFLSCQPRNRHSHQLGELMDRSGWRKVFGQRREASRLSGLPTWPHTVCSRLAGIIRASADSATVMARIGKTPDCSMSIRLFRRFINLRPRSSALDALPPDGGQAATEFREICGLSVCLKKVNIVISYAKVRRKAGTFKGIDARGG